MAALVVAVALAACGGGDPVTVEDTPDASDTRGVPVYESPWTVQTLATGGEGRHLQVAVGADDVVRAAWYATHGVTGGPCEIGGFQPPDEVHYAVTYAEQAVGDGEWLLEPVDDVLSLGTTVGLDLGVAPDGTPAIVMMTGDAIDTPIAYCGASDVGYYTRGPDGVWTAEVAVEESGEAETGEEASDFGSVVGYWASVAWDASGQPAIAYKDVHAGSIQFDDFNRADLELAWRQASGAWTALPVDFGTGAGDYTALAFGADGHPVVVYHNPTQDLISSEHGLWAAHSDDGGETWVRVQLHAGVVTERPSVATDPSDGRLWVAWYDPDDGLPRLAQLVDVEAFESLSEGWDLDHSGIADPQYDAGIHPSLAFDPQGRLNVAYRRCGLAAAGTVGGCDPDHDAVVLATREDGEWEREVVETGETGDCGMHVGLAFRADGSITVAFQCTAQDEGGAFEHVVMVAAREAIP